MSQCAHEHNKAKSFCVLLVWMFLECAVLLLSFLPGEKINTTVKDNREVAAIYTSTCDWTQASLESLYTVWPGHSHVLKLGKVRRWLFLTSVASMLCPALSNSLLWGTVASGHVLLWMTLFYNQKLVPFWVQIQRQDDSCAHNPATYPSGITYGHHTDEWLNPIKCIPCKIIKV